MIPRAMEPWPGKSSQMARLAVVGKECHFKRHSIDIIETSEQFEPRYVAINPRTVVPTLRC